MHFTVLGYENRMECNVEVIKAEEIKVSRRASQTFNFTEPGHFIEAVKGKRNVVIYVGKVKDEAGQETWKAMYWEPSELKGNSYSGGVSDTNILPLGSLAWLLMDTEFDLEWELEKKQNEFREYMHVHNQMMAWSRRIREINRESPFADTEQYRYMGTEGLKKVVNDMKQAYQKMANATTVELTDEEKRAGEEEEENREDE